MSAATFACPHCSQQYPVKPVLIGKVVRCTACKRPFRLRPDGIAEAVGAAAPPVVAAPAQEARKPDIVAAAPPVPTRTISPPTPRAPLMTKAQEDARRSMAESLRSAMGDALKDEIPQEAPPEKPRPGTERTAKQETGRTGRRPSDRKRTSSFLNPSLDPKKAGKGPAVLTGEGEREATIARNWKLFFIALALVAGGIVFLATRTNARADGLRAFTAPLPVKDLAYGRRIAAIQARAWQPITPFIDLPAPAIGTEHAIPGQTLDLALSQLKSLTWVPEHKRWITPGKVDWLKHQTIDNPAQVGQYLQRAGIVSVDLPGLHKALAGANLGDPEIDLLTEALPGPLGPQLTTGSAPTVRWCDVHGRNGAYLTDPGQGYVVRTTDYQGILVKLDGASAPSEWRFLMLAPQAKTEH